MVFSSQQIRFEVYGGRLPQCKRMEADRGESIWKKSGDWALLKLIARAGICCVHKRIWCLSDLSYFVAGLMSEPRLG